MKKFTLTISPEYVKNWTEFDAIREFVQNAIDQENADEDNKAYIKTSSGCLIIENNNSVLERKTLLLGGGDKSSNNEAIGGFGEGYKIALLVLTRLGFKVHIANYGLGELWEPEISHSVEYNTDVLKISCNELKHGKNISKGVSIIITKDSFDFSAILSKVYLKNRNPIVISSDAHYGDVLSTIEEKGNIYIGGLFIANSSKLYYGYNFKPGIITVGRDRNIIDTYTIKYHAGTSLFKNIKEEYIDEFMFNLEAKIEDFEYMDKYSIPARVKDLLKEKYKDKTVISCESDKQILKDHGIKTASAIIVPSAVKELLWSNFSSEGVTTPIKRKSMKDLLEEFLDQEKDNLTIEQYEKLENISQRK